VVVSIGAVLDFLAGLDGNGSPAHGGRRLAGKEELTAPIRDSSGAGM